MAEESAVAVSTTAETPDVFKGETPTLAEFSEYRETGELPARFKAEPAEPAPATETAKPSEPAPASESEENQDLKPKTAKRIQQLLDRIKELERTPEKKDVKPESSPAKAEPPATRPKPKPDGDGPDGKPYEAYEDYVEDLADWKAEQRIEGGKREQQKAEAQKVLQSKLDGARTRYKDADEFIFPAEKAIATAQIPEIVKRVFGDSDVYVDLCYVVGSDPEGAESFIALAKADPRAAIAKVFEYERGIKEALSKPRYANGQFAAPETKKTTAPKPPQPVNGSSSRAFDTSDESLSPEEWMRQRNDQVSRKT